MVKEKMNYIEYVCACMSGTFHFTLGKLALKYRSRLTPIHLVALVKSIFIGTYGIDAILKPFIDDMKNLV